MTSWTEALLEVESYMERYRNALKKIVTHIDEQYKPDSKAPLFILTIKEIALSALDGEPTTADEYNTMQEDEKLVFKEQFGGDTGTDADYNYECEHLNATYQAEELDTNVPESYTCDDCNKDLNIPEPDWDIMREGK
jgi:hypothetical protein